MNYIFILLFYINRGRLDCIKVLIEAGCSVNQHSTYSGQTPLHVATSKGYSECVDYLLQHGANGKIL